MHDFALRKKHFTKPGSIINKRLRLSLPYPDHSFTLILPPAGSSDHFCTLQAFFVPGQARRTQLLLLFWHLRAPPVSPP